MWMGGVPDRGWLEGGAATAARNFCGPQPITPQALDQRFTPAAAACLEQVLRTAITRLIAADPVAIPLLDRSYLRYLPTTICC